MPNINENYFDGHYKDIWRGLIPEGLTNAEVDFLIQESGLKTGDKVLDLMCGYGRHALALARQGVEVTAVDNLAEYINEVKDLALKENLPVVASQENVIHFQPHQKYDLVICMGNSLSFFNAGESRTLFSVIASCLKQGGKFVFNSWMIAEIAIKQFREKTWSYVGQIKFLADSQYLFSPARIETESIFIPSDGQAEVKKGIDYIYSLNETEDILRHSDFVVKDIWSIPGKKKFILGEPRVYIVAEKL